MYGTLIHIRVLDRLTVVWCVLLRCLVGDAQFAPDGSLLATFDKSSKDGTPTLVCFRVSSMYPRTLSLSRLPPKTTCNAYDYFYFIVW